MILNFQLSQGDVTKLVHEHFRKLLGEVPFEASDIHIEVKSRQNFKSEWEPAAFRARLEKRVDSLDVASE